MDENKMICLKCVRKELSDKLTTYVVELTTCRESMEIGSRLFYIVTVARR